MVRWRFEKRMSEHCRNRDGNVLVTLALLLPVFLAIAVLILDGSAMIGTDRRIQHSADTIALAAATGMLQEGTSEAAVLYGHRFAKQHLDVHAGDLVVASPPKQGPHAGNAECVSVTIRHTADTFLSHLLDGVVGRDVKALATARVEESSAHAAVVCLDRSPELYSITGLPDGFGSSLSLAGLEVEGLGSFKVDGAIHVNSLNGMYDEHGNRVGQGVGPPYGAACVPGLGLTNVEATEIRVAGGVANPSDYGATLKANRFPVPDPHQTLPVPDPDVHSAVRDRHHGGVTVRTLPALSKRVTLEPGVYDWLEVISGDVIFEPGVYIIRGRNPVTQHSLALLGGKIRAEGVMFYIGQNDATAQDQHQESEPPYTADTLTPSVVIAETLGPSIITGLDDRTSPFHGFLLYQDRQDRRPIAMAAQQLLGRHELSGNVYSKWGHVIFSGQGDFDMTLVAGTVRIVVVGELRLAPTTPLPGAQDVFLID